MREPAQDYLQSMLILVNASLDSLVPTLVLGTKDADDKLPLEALFTKIAQTSEVNFFASMLDQLVQTSKQSWFLCSVILFMMAVQSCGTNEKIMASAQRFITHEVSKLAGIDMALFDCSNNLCLLAFLKFCKLCDYDIHDLHLRVALSQATKNSTLCKDKAFNSFL